MKLKGVYLTLKKNVFKENVVTSITLHSFVRFRFQGDKRQGSYSLFP